MTQNRELIERARKAQAARLHKAITPTPDPTFNRSYRRVVVLIAALAVAGTIALAALAAYFIF